MALLLLVAGCAAAPVDDARQPAPPPLPEPGGCGAAAHDWLPPADQGRIADWAYVPEYDVPADAIAVVLGGFGLEGLTPVYDVRSYVVRYTTQDRGAPVEATMWLNVPDTDQVHDLVVWGHGTTGFSDACAPTALGVEGVGLQLLLASLGVVVASPDYLGMTGFGAPSEVRHPYVVPEPTAVATLDSVRAAWVFLDEGLDPSLQADVSRRLGLIGASQGGHAVLWADRYAGAYLPEAELVGTVASVPPVDLYGLARGAMTSLGDPTVALVAVAHAFSDWYGTGSPHDVLTDAAPGYLASEGWDALTASCSWSGVLDGVDDVEALFTPAALEAAQHDDPTYPPWDCFLDRGSLALSDIPRSSDAPVLLVTGGADAMVDPATVAGAVPELCDQGYRVDLIECDGAGHVDAALDSMALQWRWLADRLAGVDGAGACALSPPIDCASAALDGE